MSALLEEAAAAGQPAAVAALKWLEYQTGKSPVNLQAFREISEAAFASGDFFAVREAEGAILSMRHETLVAGLGAKDLDVLMVAFRLAECHQGHNCGTSGLLSAIHCAVEAKCSENPAVYYLSTLNERQRAAAQEAALKLVAAVENKNLAGILTKAGTSK
jgi:hypothetical protein